MMKFGPDQASRPIMNRNPDSRPNNVPLSRPTYEPQLRAPQANESMTQWSPFGIFRPAPFYGGYDALSEDSPQHSIMAVPQADLYDASPNPWPNNGQFDHPNSIGLVEQMIRLAPHTSAHRGFANPTGGGPTMLFHAPPVFSIQTRPIPAVGV